MSIELDEKVAGLRGDRQPNGTYEPARDWFLDLGAEPTQPAPYSTDDNAAAILRREMYGAQCDIDIEVMEGGLRMIVKQVGMPLVICEGNTEAEVTARAYVKWRDNQ